MKLKAVFLAVVAAVLSSVITVSLMVSRENRAAREREAARQAMIHRTADRALLQMAAIQPPLLSFQPVALRIPSSPAPVVRPVVVVVQPPANPTQVINNVEVRQSYGSGYGHDCRGSAYRYGGAIRHPPPSRQGPAGARLEGIYRDVYRNLGVPR